MKKNEIFKLIKEVNQLCDEQKKLEKNSKAFDDLSDAIYWVLEAFHEGTKYQRNVHLHYSKRTEHYWVTFN